MMKLSEQKLAFIASAQLYLSLSLLFGTWVIYIPQITDKLHMSESQLGIALFFGAIGSLIGTTSGKKMVNIYGEGKVATFSMLMQSLFMLSVFLAPSFYLLSAGFFMYGLFGGLFQVGANSMVITLERKYKISIMSSCHGFFSLGALIASGLGTFLLIALDNAILHIILAAGIVVSLQIIFAKIILPIKSIAEPKQVEAKSKLKKNAMLLALAFIAVSIMLTEGAIADWSGLYMQDVVMANKNWLGLAYAAFSLSMTIGRFVGDYFSKRYGPLQIIVGGFAIGLMGFLLVFSQQFTVVILGFFVIGSGFSIIVPEVYRVSANIDGISPSYGIAFMASAGYVGFLIGPVLLGILAESFGLSISFMVLFVLVFLGLILAGLLKRRSQLQAAKC